MALTKTGLAYLGQSLNSGGDISNLVASIEELNLKVIPARVTDIVLDETNKEKFQKYGGWNGIGTINFELVNTPEGKDIDKPIAKPLFPQIKSFPLVNEIVLLFYLPDSDIGVQDTSKVYYYLNAISIWNHPHHNAYPNIFDGVADEDQKQDYQAIEGGSVRRVEDKSTEINLQGDNPTGGTFIERSNIHPVLPFVGDNIFEGRFGNSIRLGATARSKGLYKNNWSESGEEGNPITILRNGQPIDSSDEGWLPIVENINNDLSSIYLTSNQLIPIKASSTNYTGISDENIPEFPNQYKGNQVILNSGRVLLNSTTDSILLSSKKVISLSAKSDIGIATSGSIALESGELKLGGSNAEQPAVLGDTFLDSLSGVMVGLQSMAVFLSQEPSLQLTPASATALNETINNFLSAIEDFKSKTVKIL
jgi:hypothetical protein